MDKAEKTLRRIHKYLYPEDYPDDEVMDHPHYRAGEDTHFEWRSDTIEVVGNILTDAIMDLDRPAREAKILLGKLKVGDPWSSEHDAACEVLGLDPDDYRSASTGWKAENWPPHMRGKLFEPTALQRDINRMED